MFIRLPIPVLTPLLCVTAAFAPLAVSAEAKVHTCELTSQGDISDAELRVYEFEGIIHSAFVQLTTDYGDTLPYIFICDATCEMRFVKDEYRYELQFSPSVDVGTPVVLTTVSLEDQYEFTDEFTIASCAEQTRATQ